MPTKIHAYFVAVVVLWLFLVLAVNYLPSRSRMTTRGGIFRGIFRFSEPPKLASLQNERILVTGGAGFIGHHLILELKSRGVNVIGIDNFNDYYDTRLKRARANLSDVVIEADVCDSDKIHNVLNKHRITKVVHLAAQAGVRYSLKHPQAYVRSNVQCFVELLEVLKNTNTPLVYASSSSVYGKNTKVPFTETDEVLQPRSLYAATKRENELLAHVYWDLYKQQSIGLRFFTVYGPFGRPDMAYFSFTKNILEGRPIAVFNHGKLSRDFTYIDDIVDGILRCLQINFEYEILNLGRGQPQQLMTFIRTIEEALDTKAILEYQGMSKGDVLTTYANVQKAKDLLGYEPKVSLKEGITKFAKWYLNAYNASSSKSSAN